MRSPDAKTALRWVELSALLAAGVFALIFQLRLPGRLPTEADHLKAAEHLRAAARPGDVVLLYPWWTERPRLFLPDSLPIVASMNAARMALPDAKRVWLYAQPRLPKADLPAFLAELGRLPGPVQRFGPIELSVWDNPSHRPKAFSAAQSVARARVYLEQPDGTRIDCAFDGRAHRCPGGTHVAAEWHEVLYDPHFCLWMNPPGGAGRLVAEFTDVPPGEELVLEAGLTWDRGAFVGPDYSAVNIAVEAAGKMLVDLSIPPGLQPWQRASVKTEATSVRLSVQADKAALRNTCVELTRR